MKMDNKECKNEPFCFQTFASQHDKRGLCTGEGQTTPDLPNECGMGLREMGTDSRYTCPQGESDVDSDEGTNSGNTGNEDHIENPESCSLSFDISESESSCLGMRETLITSTDVSSSLPAVNSTVNSSFESQHDKSMPCAGEEQTPSQDVSTLEKLDYQDNPNLDACSVGSSWAAMMDIKVGSSSDMEHKNDVNLMLWKLRANRINQILSIPHEEGCPLYSYSRCKNLGIDFNVGTGMKQNLDPQFLTNGIMVELITFATALLSSTNYFITEILEHNFNLNLNNEDCRSAFAHQTIRKFKAMQIRKGSQKERHFELPDTRCIRETIEKTLHCPKCHQDQNHKLHRDESGPGDTASVDETCTTQKPAEDLPSAFSTTEETIMDSNPHCKKMGLSLCVDTGKPKDKLDTHVLTGGIMMEVVNFSKKLCGTSNKVINDVLEHNFDIGMLSGDLNPAALFKSVMRLNDGGPAWLEEVFVIRPLSHRQPGHVSKLQEAALAIQRSEWRETMQKRKLALQTKEERAILPTPNISGVKSKKSRGSKGNLYPICKEIGLNLDVTSKSGQKEKLDLKQLTKAVVLEIHGFATEKAGHFYPRTVFDILDCNFDLSSQHYRRWEFSIATASKVQTMVKHYGKKQEEADEVFKLPFVFDPKASQKLVERRQNKKSANSSLGITSESESSCQGSNAPFLTSTACPLGESDVDSDEGTDSGNTGNEDHLENQESWSLSSDIPKELESSCLGMHETFLTSTDNSFSLPTVNSNVNSAFASQHDNRGLCGGEEQTPSPQIVPNKCNMEQEEMETESNMWKLRSNRVEQILSPLSKELGPFNRSKKLGLEFNVGFGPKQNISADSLTNAILLEIAKFALAINSSQKEFIVEILEYNFDLSLQSQHQRNTFACEIMNRVKQLRCCEEEVTRSNEVFELPGPRPSINVANQSVGSVIPELRSISGMETCDVAPVCLSDCNSVDLYPFCKEIGLTLHVNSSQPNRKLEINKMTNGAMTEVTNFAVKLCGTFEQICLDILRHNLDLDLKSGDSDPSKNILARIPAVMEQRNLSSCVKAHKNKKWIRKDVSTLEKLDYQNNPNLDACSAGSSQTAMTDTKVGSSPDMECKNDLSLMLWKLRANQIQQILSIPHEEHCPLYSFSRCKKLGIDFDVGSGVKQNLDPQFLTHGIMVELNTFAKALLSSTKHFITEILEYNFNLNLTNEHCRSAFANQTLEKFRGRKDCKGFYLDRHFELPDTRCIQETTVKTLYCPKCYQDRNHKLRQDTGHLNPPHPHSMTDTASVDGNCTAQKPAKDLSSTFSITVETIMNSYPSCKKIGLSLCVDTGKPKDKLDTHVLTGRTMKEVVSFAKKLCGTKGKIVNDVLEHNFSIGTQSRDLNPAVLFQNVMKQNNSGLAWLDEVFVIRPPLHSKPRNVSKTKEATFATQRSRWKEAIQKRMLALQTKEEKATEPSQNISVKKSKKNQGNRAKCYPLCTEIGLDLDMTSKSRKKEKLDLKLLTTDVVYEIHKFAAKNAGHYYPRTVFDILDYNFDVSSQHYRRWEFSIATASKVKTAVKQYRQNRNRAGKVFKLPFVFAPKEGKKGLFEGEEQTQTPSNVPNKWDMGQEQMRPENYYMCPLGESDLDSDEGTDSGNTGNEDHFKNPESCSLSSDIPNSESSYLGIHAPFLTTTDVSSSLSKVNPLFASQSDERGLFGGEEQTQTPRNVPNKWDMKEEEMETENHYTCPLGESDVDSKEGTDSGNTGNEDHLENQESCSLSPDIPESELSCQGMHETLLTSTDVSSSLPTVNSSVNSPFESQHDKSMPCAGEEQTPSQDVSTLEKLDYQDNSNSDACSAGSSWAAMMDIKVGSSSDMEYKNDGNLMLWKLRANRIKQILSIPHEEGCPLYPYSRCKNLGIDFNVGTGMKQNLDPQFLTNGIMVELNTFAKALLSSTNYFIAEILEYNFNLNLNNEDCRHSFGQKTLYKFNEMQSCKGSQKERHFELPDTSCIRKIVEKTQYCPKCYQDQNYKLHQDESGPGDMNPPHSYTMTDTASVDETCTTQTPAEDLPSAFSTTEETIMDSNPHCKKIGFSLCVDTGKPKDKLDTHVLTGGIMKEVINFSKKLRGTSNKVINDVLEHNFNIGMLSGDLNPAALFKSVMRLNDGGPAWLEEVFVIRTHSHRQPGHVSKLQEAALAIQRSEWRETIQKRKLALQTKEERAILPNPNISVKKSKKNRWSKAHVYPICTEIGLDLDVTSKSGQKEKLDLKLLTKAVVLEIHEFATEKAGHYYPRTVFDILDCNFDLSSQHYRRWEFSLATASKVQTMVKHCGKKQEEADEVFKLPFVFDPKASQKLVERRQNKKSANSSLGITSESESSCQGINAPFLTSTACPLGESDVDSDEGTDSGNTGNEDHLENQESWSLSSDIPKELESSCLGMHETFLTSTDNSFSLPTVNSNVNSAFASQHDKRGLCGDEEQTPSPQSVPNKCNMEQEEMETESNMWKLRSNRVEQILSPLSKEFGPFNRSKKLGLEFNVGFGPKQNISADSLNNSILLEIAKFALAINSSQKEFIMEILEYNFDLSLQSQHQRNTFACEIMNKVRQLRCCEEEVRCSNEVFELPGPRPSINMANQSVGRVIPELSSISGMEKCDVAPVCLSDCNSVNLYPFCKEIGLTLHVNSSQPNRKLEINKMTNGAMTEVTNFAVKLCGTFEQIYLDILRHNLDLDLKSGDSDLAKNILAQIPAVMEQRNLSSCVKAHKNKKWIGKDVSTLEKLDYQNNPNLDACSAGSSQTAMIDTKAGSSPDMECKNDLSLMLWKLRANQIQQILSIPHEEHCPLYSFSRCKKLGINFDVGSGVKQNLDPQFLTHGIMVELNTFAKALLSSTKYFITEILEYNFNLNLTNEHCRSAFANQILEKCRGRKDCKGFYLDRHFELPDTRCIQETTAKTLYCPKCYQDRKHKLRQDPGHLNPPHPHTMTDTASVGGNCTAQKPVKDPFSTFSITVETIMNSYPSCKKIGLSLCVDTGKPKDKLDTHVLTGRTMKEVAHFAKKLCGTKSKIVNDVLEHNFDIGMQARDLNPAVLFQNVMKQNNSGLAWLDEMFVIRPPPKQLRHVSKMKEATFATQRSRWKEAIQKRMLALQMREERATEPSQNISVKKSKKNQGNRAKCYPLCTEIGLDLDMTSKSRRDEKLDLKLLTTDVVYEIHKFTTTKTGHYYPRTVFDILDYNFDVSSQHYRRWEFSLATAFKVKTTVKQYRQNRDGAGEVFKLPFVFAPKKRKRGLFEGEAQTQTPSNVPNKWDMEQEQMRPENYYMCPLGESDLDSDEGTDSGNTGKEDHFKNPESCSLSSDIPNSESSCLGIHAPFLTTTDVSSSLSKVNPLFASQSDERGLFGGEEQTQTPRIVPNECDMEEEEMETENHYTCPLGDSDVDSEEGTDSGNTGNEDHLENQESSSLTPDIPEESESSCQGMHEFFLTSTDISTSLRTVNSKINPQFARQLDKNGLCGGEEQTQFPRNTPDECDMEEENCQNNPNLDSCSASSSQAILDQNVGSSTDLEHKNNLKLLLWKLRANRIQKMLSIPHEEHCPLYSYAKCKKLGIDFNVGSGVKQNLDPKFLTHGIMIELNTFASVLISSTKYFITEILEHNFNLNLASEHCRSAFAQQTLEKFRGKKYCKGSYLKRHFELPDTTCIQETTAETFCCPECYQGRNHKLRQDPVHSNPPHPHTMTDTASVDGNCTVQKSAKDLSSIFSTTEQIIMDSNPYCKKIGLSLCVDTGKPKDKLDTHVLTGRTMKEVINFSKKLCGTSNKVINDVLEHNFDIGMLSGDLNPAALFKSVMRLNDGGPAWLEEVFVIRTISHRQPGHVTKLQEATFATQRSRWKETAQKRKLALQTKEERATLPNPNISVKKSKKNLGTKGNLYPICTEIGLDLDVTSKSGQKEKLDLKLLTKAVVLEIHEFATEKAGHYYPRTVFDILDYNFDLSSQHYRRWEFSIATASKVQTMVKHYGKRQEEADEVFKLPFVFDPKASQKLVERRQMKSANSSLGIASESESSCQGINAPFLTSTACPLGESDVDSDEGTDSGNTGNEDHLENQESWSLSSDIPKESESSCLGMHETFLTSTDNSFSLPTVSSNVNSAFASQHDKRGLCGSEEQTPFPQSVPNKCNMEQEEMETESNMWKLRSNRVEQILSPLSKEFGPFKRSKKLGLEFNVGFGPKQNISVDSLTNAILLEIAKFAVAINSSQKEFIMGILEYNFDLSLQSQHQKNNFACEIMNRVRQLRCCEEEVRRSNEVFELPGPRPSINMANQSVGSVIPELSSISGMEKCDVAPVCPPDSHAETKDPIFQKSVDLYPFCEEIGLKLHVNNSQPNRKLEINKMTNGAMTEVTNFAEKLCGTFEQICLDILKHNLNLDSQNGDSDPAQDILAQIPAIIEQINLSNCVTAYKKLKGKPSMDFKNNPNLDACNAGSSQAAIIDQNVGSSVDIEHKNDLSLMLWKLRANRIKQILSIPHVEHCPLYSYSRCKKLGIDFSVGSGIKQNLDPKFLTNGVMVELNTFASALLSSTKHFITEILEYNFHLNLKNELYRSAFVHGLVCKVTAMNAIKGTSELRWNVPYKLPNIQEPSFERGTYCPKCYQERNHKLQQDESDTGHVNPRPHTMTDTSSVDENCTAQKPAKDPSSTFSTTEETLMDSYPRCKTIGLSLCVDTGKPKDKLDTRVLTRGIMLEVSNFAKKLCGTKRTIILELLDHIFNIGMQHNPYTDIASMFRRGMADKGRRLTWFDEVFVTQPLSHRQPRHVTKLHEAALAIQRSEWRETIQKRKLALQTKEERATLTHPNSVVKSKKNHGAKVSLYPICTEIGLDLDVTSKSEEKEKLDLKLLTNAVVYEINKFAVTKSGHYFPGVVFDILDYNFDLSSQHYRRWEFSIATASKVQIMVRQYRKNQLQADKVFKLPFVSAPKASQRPVEKKQNKKRKMSSQKEPSKKRKQGACVRQVRYNSNDSQIKFLSGVEANRKRWPHGEDTNYLTDPWMMNAQSSGNQESVGYGSPFPGNIQIKKEEYDPHYGVMKPEPDTEEEYHPHNDNVKIESDTGGVEHLVPGESAVSLGYTFISMCPNSESNIKTESENEGVQYHILGEPQGSQGYAVLSLCPNTESNITTELDFSCAEYPGEAAPSHGYFLIPAGQGNESALIKEEQESLPTDSYLYGLMSHTKSEEGVEQILDPW